MLIRDFHDIRDVIRLFFTYGFLSKRDITARNGMKEITYDKYKKTIQNLIDNTKISSYTNDKREKCMHIKIDYVQETDNPLFTIWQGKSITANDIWYLTAITDALTRSEQGATVADVTKALSLYTNRGIEEQTVRNRLAELHELGLVVNEKRGKQRIYALHGQFLEKLPEEQILEFDTTCAFFQNVYPIGVLGNHMRRRVSHCLQNVPSTFMFKHHHVGGTVDDEALLEVLQAIQERRRIRFDLQLTQDKGIRFKSIPFIPMKLVADLWQGRRYIVGYDEEYERCWSFRLDKMFHIEPRERYEGFEERKVELEKQLSKSWCVVMQEPGRTPDLVVMTLAIDPEQESYILNRLQAEGKWGTVEQISQERYEYRIEVNDAEEMLPWLRTFIGRIVDLQCSNSSIAMRLLEDCWETLRQYEHEETI